MALYSVGIQGRFDSSLESRLYETHDMGFIEESESQSRTAYCKKKHNIKHVGALAVHEAIYDGKNGYRQKRL